MGEQFVSKGSPQEQMSEESSMLMLHMVWTYVGNVWLHC